MFGFLVPTVRMGEQTLREIRGAPMAEAPTALHILQKSCVQTNQKNPLSCFFEGTHTKTYL